MQGKLLLSCVVMAFLSLSSVQVGAASNPMVSITSAGPRVLRLLHSDSTVYTQNIVCNNSRSKTFSITMNAIPGVSAGTISGLQPNQCQSMRLAITPLDIPPEGIFKGPVLSVTPQLAASSSPGMSFWQYQPDQSNSLDILVSAVNNANYLFLQPTTINSLSGSAAGNPQAPLPPTDTTKIAYMLVSNTSTSTTLTNLSFSLAGNAGVTTETVDINGLPCTALAPRETCLTAIYNGTTSAIAANASATVTVSADNTESATAEESSINKADRAILSTTDNLNISLANGGSKTLTVTNNGPTTAYNLSFAFAADLIQYLGVSTSGCKELIAGQSCTMTVSASETSTGTVGPLYFAIYQNPFPDQVPSYASSLVGTITIT